MSSPARRHRAATVHIVNAFTDSAFGGNPAAVMLLDEWLSDAQLQALAAQHNLSETAFLFGSQKPYMSYVGYPRCRSALVACNAGGCTCSVVSWVQVMVQCSSTHGLEVS